MQDAAAIMRSSRRSRRRLAWWHADRGQPTSARVIASSALEARVLDVVTEVGPCVAGHSRLEDFGVHRPERGLGLSRMPAEKASTSPVLKPGRGSAAADRASNVLVA